MSEENKLNTKKTKAKVVQTLVDAESKSVSELKKELQRMKLEIHTGKQTDTSTIRKIKRIIARKLTNNSN